MRSFVEAATGLPTIVFTAALAWGLAVAAGVLSAVFVPSVTGAGLLRPVVPSAALFVAWRLTRLFVRPLHRVFPAARGEPDGSHAPGGSHEYTA